MAGRLNTHWFVVYVETPEESPDRIRSDAQRHLLDNFQKAEELGAEVVRLKSRDPVAAVLDFARSHSVSDILIGRSSPDMDRELRVALDRGADLIILDDMGTDAYTRAVAESPVMGNRAAASSILSIASFMR